MAAARTAASDDQRDGSGGSVTDASDGRAAVLVPPVTVATRVAAAAKAVALESDEARAYHLFEAAAQQGDAAAMAGLAECHLYGRGGVARDWAVAVGWFALAAAKRHPRAIVECEALRMAHGAGALRKSKPMQRVLLATLGRGRKLYALAKRCYELGRAGDELRLRWAAQILTWCVRRGEARALVALGKLRLEGSGVSPSTVAAAALFERAAELQHAPGAVAAARLQWEVRGDLVGAFVWYRISAALGSAVADAPLAQLTSTLHPALAAKAELRASRWLQQHAVQQHAVQQHAVQQHAESHERPPVATSAEALSTDVLREPSGTVLAPSASHADSEAATDEARGTRGGSTRTSSRAIEGPHPASHAPSWAADAHRVPSPTAAAAVPAPLANGAAAEDPTKADRESTMDAADGSVAHPLRGGVSVQLPAVTGTSAPDGAAVIHTNRSAGYSDDSYYDEPEAAPTAPFAALAAVPPAAPVPAPVAAPAVAPLAATALPPAAPTVAIGRTNDEESDGAYYSGSYYSDDDDELIAVSAPYVAEQLPGDAIAGAPDPSTAESFARANVEQEEEMDSEVAASDGASENELDDVASSQLYDYYSDEVEEV